MGLNEEIQNDLKNIPMRDYLNVWYSFMKKHQCDTVCELGIFKGDNFMNMIKHNPKLAVAVDSWKDNGVHPRETDDYTQNEFDEQYEFFKNRVSNKPFVKIIRDITVNAAKQFPDDFFDLVYVDADHSFEGCLNDLTAWYSKIKPGRFLTGHDYAHRLRKKFGVFSAVNKFAEENNLEILRFGLSNWAVVKK